MHITKIIKYPLLTEKSYHQIGENYYTFAVHPKANKLQIKSAFETIFEVGVESVNTISMKPKSAKVGRFVGFKPKVKKAIIKLKPGEKLDIFSAGSKNKK